MLMAGGTFIDAAIATSAVLCVVEPWASHLGGDAFIVLYDAGRKQTFALNASGPAPQSATPDRFPNGIPLRGLSSATVPGLVDAWFQLHGRYGRTPMARLLEPAIRYAREGYPISPRKESVWRNASRSSELRPILSALLHQERPPRVGEIVRCPDLARTLQQIASEGRNAFYRGEIARQIAQYSQRTGGLMTYEDLEGYQSEWREPLQVDYRGHTVHIQPPVSQGIILAESLALMEGFANLRDLPPAERTHLMIEAIKLAYADRWRYLGDPRFVAERTKDLLSPDYIAKRRADLSRTQATSIPSPGELRDTNTTYFCVADAQGNAISFIQSVYHPFGCGVVIEGTGILMNNRMRGFSLDPNSPNRLEPGKRPMHTLNAYLITRRGELAYVGGTPGGDIQVQTNLQVISQMLDFGLDPQSAIEQPRWAWQPTRSTDPSPGTLTMEIAGEESTLVEDLRKRGHSPRTTPHGTHPSAVQVIQRVGGAYLAGSDPRTEGEAVGF